MRNEAADLAEGTEGTASQFADSTELGIVPDTPSGCAAVQVDLAGLDC